MSVQECSDLCHGGSLGQLEIERHCSLRKIKLIVFLRFGCDSRLVQTLYVWRGLVFFSEPLSQVFRLPKIKLATKLEKMKRMPLWEESHWAVTVLPDKEWSLLEQDGVWVRACPTLSLRPDYISPQGWYPRSEGVLPLKPSGHSTIKSFV